MRTVSYFYTNLLLYLSLLIISASSSSRPNIVFIIADDLGWDDVSFHGSDQIPTPNIDLLAYSGLALGRYYSHCICTPARSALLTGKFSHVTGMQGMPLSNSEDRGLPKTEKILPQYFKDLGYDTHLVGKWHVGQSRTEFLPTNRGFDTHFGHRGGYIDYYQYTTEEPSVFGDLVSGMGLYRNLNVSWDTRGYITDVFTDEAKAVIMSHDTSKPLFLMVSHNAPHSANSGAILQAPPEDVRAMHHVESEPRRIYAASVKKLDDSVGEIVETLLQKGILNNTIIVFVADNGGITSGISVNYASNWPLRGLKLSPFEGGTHVVGALWAANLSVSDHLWNGNMHIVDWLPTLLRAAGANPPSDIDGMDLWNELLSNKVSTRGPIFEIDDYTGFASILLGDHKLVIGNPDKLYSNHQGGNLRGIIGGVPSYEKTIKESKMYSVLDKFGQPFQMEGISLRHKIKVDCKTNFTDEDICYPSDEKYCLFNVKEDPCEINNIFEDNPEVAEKLLKRLKTEVKRTIPRVVPLAREAASLPRLHNYTWVPWADKKE